MLLTYVSTLQQIPVAHVVERMIGRDADWGMGVAFSKIAEFSRLILECDLLGNINL